AALSALAYVSMVASMLAMGWLAVRKCGLTLRDGMLAGLVLLILIFYTGITAIGPFAVFIVCVALLVLYRWWAFGPVSLVAGAINEKIGLVLAIWLTVRWVLVPADRARLTLPWVLALAGVALHLALVLWLRFPGHEYQLRPSGFVGTVVDNLQ